MNHPDAQTNASVPYYAVIFSSTLTGSDTDGYGEMADHMEALAKEQEGFLGVESAARTPDTRLGITVSYWKDLESIRAWKSNAQHAVAQRLGREVWYQSYRLRIAKIEREYGFQRDGDNEINELIGA
jgi:heme-degrading monooxygenase HmoA